MPSLKEDLKFVSHAVARKTNLDDRYSHLIIRDGVAMAYDGLIAMRTPIDTKLHIKPHAKLFAQAMDACGKDASTATLSVTPGGKLTVKAGKFKAHVPCLDNEDMVEFPTPKGEEIVVSDELFDAIADVAPFIGEDENRLWATGVHITDKFVHATNSIVLIERFHGTEFPTDVILPLATVQTLLKIDQHPTRVQMTENTMTFWFGEHRWLCSALVDSEWPSELITPLLNKPSSPVAMPPEFYSVVDGLSPFLNDRALVRLESNSMASSQADDEGATIEIEIPNGAGQLFKQANLASLKGVAERFDFSMFPNPCAFYGKKLRGVLVGFKA